MEEATTSFGFGFAAVISRAMVDVAIILFIGAGFLTIIYQILAGKWPWQN